MTYVIVLLVLFAVAFVITGPLRRPEHSAGSSEVEDVTQPSPEILGLEAARDAKYREIRDAELDFQTGKLSEADFQAIDSTLRTEAVEILRRLDDVEGQD